VLRFIERGGTRTILAAGSDELGALYACVSLRWLIEKGAQGPTVSPVNMRDWPDFKWRGAPSMMFAKNAARNNDDLAPTVHGFIDWCLRRKLNVLRDYHYFRPGKLPKEPIDWIVDANRYAQERGFLTFEYQSTALHDKRAGKPDPGYVKNAAIVSHNRHFTWADDAALLKRTSAVAKMCADNGFNILGLHPPDGGGVMDPSQFSKRSAYDREHYSDDQRAEADAHVYNMYYREARKLQPRIRIALTVYPYSPIYQDYEHMKQRYPELTPQLYERNVNGYYRRLAKLIPKDVHLFVREGRQDHVKAYRAFWGDRPATHWCDFAGRWHRQPYFTTTFRFIGSSFHDHDDDVMMCMHTRIRPNLVNYCATAEYTWNVNAPGAEPYVYERTEVLQDAKRPRVMIEEFIPKACRNTWGPEAGPLMAPLFQTGLSAALLCRTASVLDFINRPRRSKEQPDQQFTAALAKEQMEAAAASLPGVERALREKPAMHPYALKAVVYYYRRVRLLHVVAQLRYHITHGTDLADADKDAAAMAEVKAG